MKQDFFNNEQWLPVEGYNNYMVSDYGNVINVRTGRILKQAINKSNGYLQVILYNEDGCNNFTVHRLVANAFIPNPEGKLTVDHINGIKTDNRVCNLRWATMKEQANYNNHIGHYSEKEKARQRDCYYRNREARKNYYQDNREARKKYYQQNKDKYNEYSKNYYKQNKDKWREYYKNKNKKE